MAYSKEVLAMIMAGGRGERLYPLTLERSKPSVCFGGKYRIIDFVLSNFVNSGIYSMYVLVQYKSQSLIEHIRTNWRRQGMTARHFITVVPPQMRTEGQDWYRGTADSTYQNINLIYDFNPKIVAVFGADHIYRMNIKEVVDFHLAKKADLTIATIPVLLKDSQRFGILEKDKSMRITHFREKPKDLHLNNKSNKFLASMGNYIFNTDVLIKAIEEDNKDKNSSHDFGKDVIPRIINSRAKVFAYDFSKNHIPSLKKYEDRTYWRDVGNIENFFQCNMDLLGRYPKLDLNNDDWPIHASSLDRPPSQINNSQIINSLICEGCRLDGTRIKNSIIGRGVILEENVEVEDSIVMDFCHVKKGAKIKNSVIDRFNTIMANTRIGFNPKEDKASYFLDDSGIVVIKRGPRQLLSY
ncbi:MAG: glucose-1-phosphate adenylyltransferase [Candidatus Omnitrophota bacterium]